MIQTFDIMLNARASNEDFKETVYKSYALLSTLKEYGKELSPNYLPAYHKKDTKEYNLTYESLEELIKKGVNKEGGRIFEDLGYTVQFFSSMNDKESAGIMLHVGSTNPRFINFFSVNLPISMNMYDDETIEKIIDLFKRCIRIFNPFWGCIANSLNGFRFNSFYVNDKPTTIHWVNFWDINIINQITEKRIKSSSLYSVNKIDDKGYLLVLKKKPIDDANEEDIKIQRDINKKLGLVGFQK